METTRHSRQGISDQAYGVRDRSGYAPWLVGLIVMLALTIPFYSQVYRIDHSYMTGRTTVPRVADTLVFLGHQYLATGPAETLADNQLRVVGRAEDGRAVYASTAPQGGGGAYGTRAPYARVYVKTGPNRYLPLEGK
jgi:hypothetical protein